MNLRALAGLLAAALVHTAWADPVKIERVSGQSSITLEDAVTDLSGITWAGGDRFYAVSDKQNSLVPITLKIDPATGVIRSGSIGAAIPVPAKCNDFEGVAFIPESGRTYIAAEHPATIVSVTPGQGEVRTFTPPLIFTRARRGLGLESLTWDGPRRQFWIANEEAFESDGPVSDPKTGTLVRLQRLSATIRPVAQYAYRTERAAMRYGSGCGVADLLSLPSGTLLVLERGFLAFGLSVRIYAVDFTRATDVTRIPSLATGEFQEVEKTLLFSEGTGFVNYEGLTLGPTLADGTRSLILIADSNKTPTHTFLPLRIRF